MKKGILYAVFAALLWSIVAPFIKQGLSYDFSPLNFAGLRFTAVGVILLIYTWRKELWRQALRHWRLFTLLVVGNIFLGYTAFYLGINLVQADIASIVIGMNPLINVLMAHFIAKDDRLDAYKVASMVISLAGLLLIVVAGNNGDPLGWSALGGVGLIFLSIALMAHSTIRISEEEGDIDPIFLNGVQMFFGGLLLYGTGIMIEGYHPIAGKPLPFYLSLAILVLVSTFAFSFWFIALRSKGTKVSDLNMTKFINPIVGAVLSWIMLRDEHPTFATVAGMFVIALSIVIYFKGKELIQLLKSRYGKKEKPASVENPAE